MRNQNGGALRRIVTAGATGALVAGVLTMAAVPAQAADGNLRGTVVDPNGNPLNGYVSVYDAANAQVGPSAMVNAGRIEATIPEAGEFRVKFSTSDSRFTTEYYLDKSTLAAADSITSGAGIVQMQPWTIDFAPYIRGVVTDPSGKPIDDVEVGIYTADTENYLGTSTTDEDGNFQTRTSISAPVKLRFEADDYASEWFNDKPSIAAADALVATSAGLDVGSVVLTSGATVSGVVKSDAGAPLELITVQAYDPVTDMYAQDDTDANGAYVLEGLTAGSYEINAYDGVGEYLSEYYLDAANSAAATPVGVASEQAVGGINMSLAPDPSVKTGVDISGTVVNESGKPLVGVEVSARTTPADPKKSGSLVQSVLTNRQGVYQLDKVDGIPDDAVKVYAGGYAAREKDSFGVQGAWLGNVQASDAATLVPINALPRAGADISLVTDGGVSGTVTSDTGARLKSAYVGIENEDGVRVSTVSAKSDGTYKFQALKPGNYSLYFTADEHVGEYWNDTVRAKASVVVVTSGQMTTGISAVLTKSLVAVDRPTIAGTALVGSTLTATKGTWNMMTGATYSYEWLADGVAVSAGPSILLTSAHFGKTIVARVSSQTQSAKAVFNGVAVSESTAAVQATTMTKAKAKIKKGKKAKNSKVKLKVSAGDVPAAMINGTVTIKLAKSKKKMVKVGSVKVKNGKATVKVAKLLKSKKLRKQLRKMGAKKAKRAKLLFVFSGSNFVESQAAVKVKKLTKGKKKKKGGKKGGKN